MLNLGKPVKILLVYPEIPDSYWGFQKSAALAGRKSFHPPLALITIAACLPQHWELKLVDLGAEKLRDETILWADAIFTTAMIIQRNSLQLLLRRAHELGTPTVVGGPFINEQPLAPEIEHATTLFFGEVEDPGAIQALVEDLSQGRELHSSYRALEFPALEHVSPVPRFDLLNPKIYHSRSLQISRGCPHSCEFCSVRKLYGTRPRYKSAAQVIAELEAIYTTGFRGNIFVVDDNLVGHRKKAKLILHAITAWQTEHRYPFLFYTQADIGIARQPELMDLMVQAGFTRVFIGIETTSEFALIQSGKRQNIGVDPVEEIQTIQAAGMQVDAGIIIFDTDDREVFRNLQEMIWEAGVDSAMVGLLIAIPGTPLYDRVKREGRLIEETGGDQFGFTNIRPTNMSLVEMYEEYYRLLRNLYGPRNYFRRAQKALRSWNQRVKRQVSAHEYTAVPRSLIRQGWFSTYFPVYWWFLLSSLFTSPGKLAVIFAKAIAGHHFIRYTADVVLPRLKRKIKALRAEDVIEFKQRVG